MRKRLFWKKVSPPASVIPKDCLSAQRKREELLLKTRGIYWGRELR